MTNSENTPSGTSPRRRYKKIREGDSWLRDRFDPTKNDRETWRNEGLPADDEIIAGFLMTNDLVFGVPDKATIFDLARTTAEEDEAFRAPWFSRDGYMHLRVIQPTRLPFVYTLAHPPIGTAMGDIIEHNYNVRIRAVSVRMVLHRIRVLNGSETDDDPKIVFQGTEFPGPAMFHNIRVIQVTVHEPGFATWKVVSETKYP